MDVNSQRIQQQIEAGEDYDFGPTVAEPIIYIDTEDSGANKQYLAGTRIRTKRDVKSFKELLN
ncbi:hypothetical protein KUTeg_022996 [Tegillarca granosa]|uniref:Uncharacterized protein n=1 Tax=Tegillarca granosa TaxID=220873 RepID=A0ABQ9E3F5_TEGGR|nr:hypothetical protein KUTeg_022996 [Tegillarca granosa]